MSSDPTQPRAGPPASPFRGAGWLARIDRGRALIEGTITGLLLGGAILLVVYTAAVRYVTPAQAPAYTDEITVYAVMWAALLACSAVTHRRQHVRADLVIHVMPPRPKHLAEIAANLTGFGFCLMLAWLGWLVTHEAWDFNDLSPTNLRFPLWIYYAALPVAALLMALGHLRVTIELLLSGPEYPAESSREEL